MRPQLKSRQICFFLIAFVPVTKLFMMSSIIAGIAKEDMWISTLLNVALDVISLLCICFACKKAQADFITILENNLGKTGKNILLFLYFIYFLLKAVIPINEQKDYVELTLYMTQPTLLTFLPVLLCSFFLCLKELRTLGRLADVIWIVTLVGFITLMALSVGSTDFSALLPIGVNGLGNILKGSYSSFIWFGDISYLIFFIGKFNYQKHDTLKIVFSYLATGVMVIFFTMVFFGVFTSIAFRQQFALTEISKYSTVINSIGRFDYVAILLLLFSNMFAISMPIYFAVKMLQGIFPIKQKWIFPLCVTSAYALLLLFFNEFFYSIEQFMLIYANGYFLLLGNILPIFTVFLRNKEKKGYAIKTC